MAKFKKQLFNQQKFFWHDTSSCTCSIFLAKYQKASVKALAQVDFPVYAQAKSLFKSKQEKMANITMLLFCQKHFLASNFFMQMFNESILCRQSIELFQHKLWYKLNSPHMHYLYTCCTKLLR